MGHVAVTQRDASREHDDLRVRVVVVLVGKHQQGLVVVQERGQDVLVPGLVAAETAALVRSIGERAALTGKKRSVSAQAARDLRDFIRETDRKYVE